MNTHTDKPLSMADVYGWQNRIGESITGRTTILHICLGATTINIRTFASLLHLLLRDVSGRGTEIESEKKAVATSYPVVAESCSINHHTAACQMTSNKCSSTGTLQIRQRRRRKKMILSLHGPIPNNHFEQNILNENMFMFI